MLSGWYVVIKLMGFFVSVIKDASQVQLISQHMPYLTTQHLTMPFYIGTEVCQYLAANDLLRSLIHSQIQIPTFITMEGVLRME